MAVVLGEEEMKQWFDRSVVISLPRRIDRLSRFRTSFDAGLDWSSRPLWSAPEAFAAVDGSAMPLPNEWKLHGQHNAGRGAWGCLRSHVRVLEDAMQAGVDSVLIFEDDAVFRPGFQRDLESFMSRVPGDWECLMLGGGHSSQPTLIDDREAPHVVRCFETHRTHAYAVRGQFLRDLYVAWVDCKTHCDHVLGRMMRSRKVYAPFAFLVGQGEGESDVNGQHNQERFWLSPTGEEPVAFLVVSDPRILDAMRMQGPLYLGPRLNDRGVAVSLDHVMRLTRQSDREDKLRKWVAERQSECLSSGKILGLWHPQLSEETARKAWPTVVKIEADSVEAGLRGLECLTCRG